MRFLPILILAALPAWAGEYAVLTSGFRLHADRHEDSGTMVRLIEKDHAVVLPATMISGFEPDMPAPAPVVEPALPEPGSPESLPKRPNPPPVASAPVNPAAPVPAANDLASNDPKALLQAAADRSGLPPAFGTLVQSVAKAESGLNPQAVSPKGAIGVMQLTPGTARSLGADPKDVRQNIDAGARLLRDLLQKYDGDVVKALAAYNAGEAAVDRYQGVPPYRETQHYVNRVVRDYINNGGPESPSGGSQ